MLEDAPSEMRKENPMDADQCNYVNPIIDPLADENGQGDERSHNCKYAAKPLCVPQEFRAPCIP